VAEKLGGRGGGTPRRPAVIRAAALFAIAIIAAAAFAPSLRFGLVYDDEEQILANPSLRSLATVPRAFTENVWAFEGGATNAYRPLQTIGYTLTYQVSGARPFLYHAVNVALHAVSAILVALLAAELGAVGAAGAMFGAAGAAVGAAAAGSAAAAHASALVPLAAGLVFALHPIHAEPVAWVAALPDLLATFFALLAAVLYARGGRAEPGGRAARAGSVVATAAALLSKEAALAVPLLLAAQELTDSRRPRRLARLWPHFALIPIYFLARGLALGAMAPLVRWDHGPGATLLAILARVGDDARRLAFPFGFAAFIPFHPPTSLFAPRVVAGAAVIALVVWGARRLLLARSPSFAALAWLALPVIPTLYLPGLGEVVTADRYLSMSSAGFALLLARLLDAPAFRAPAFARPIAGRVLSRGALAGLAIAAAYALSTRALLSPWRDSMTLYDAVIARWPDVHQIRLRRALTFMRAGDLVRARADLEAAVASDADFAEGWMNLGVFERRAGRADAAREAFARARALHETAGHRRGVADILASEGELARSEGDAARAESLFLAAIREDSTHVVAHNNLGALYAGTPGRTDLALRELEAAARAAPWHATSHENLGNLYAALERWDDAARAFGRAARLDPSSAPVRVRLGLALERLGRTDDARAAYREALRLDPANAAARARAAALAK